MSYEDTISNVVKVVEAVGAAIRRLLGQERAVAQTARGAHQAAEVLLDLAAAVGAAS